jgi:hypothetical protein
VGRGTGRRARGPSSWSGAPGFHQSINEEVTAADTHRFHDRLVAEALQGGGTPSAGAWFEVPAAPPGSRVFKRFSAATTDAQITARVVKGRYAVGVTMTYHRGDDARPEVSADRVVAVLSGILAHIPG